MNTLQKILKTKKKEILQINLDPNQKRSKPIRRFSPINFSLIAELKPKSPAAGVLRSNFDPASIIQEFESIGANAISVLTDSEYFGGSLELLSKVSESTELPVLRKDFILEQIQIKESFLAGADIILLIVKILEPLVLQNLLKYTLELGLTALVEVGIIEELQTAVEVIQPLDHSHNQIIIGVNNRDLDTFEVDIETSLVLYKYIPKNLQSLSLSGIYTLDDLQSIQKAGFGGVLVGEGLIKNAEVFSEFFSKF
jgi:indole-3-glycerol phosphate synthase